MVLKARIISGNRYDLSFLPELIEELSPKRVLVDAGYDSRKNQKVCREKGAEPYIAGNLRNSGEEYELSEVLKRKRSVVERFNFGLKELLQESWRGFKGFAKKTTIIYTALIVMSTIAIQALLTEDDESMRKISLYRN